jgi:hypothetical protein
VRQVNVPTTGRWNVYGPSIGTFRVIVRNEGAASTSNSIGWLSSPSRMYAAPALFASPIAPAMA